MIGLEDLLENTTECIAASLLDGKIFHSNTAMRRLFKYSKEEFESVNFSELYQNKKEFDRVSSELADNGSFRGVVRNRAKDGEEFVCFLSASSIKDDKDEIIGYVGISYLIESDTDIKRDENLTNMFSHEKLANLLGSIQTGIAISEPDGRLAWCNNQYEEITGDKQIDVIGKSLIERFQVPHFSLHEFTEVVNGDYIGKSFEVPFYKLNFGLRWIRVDASEMSYQGNDYIVELHTDITDLKMNSIQLMEAQERFDVITESIESVFFLYDFISRSYEYISQNCEGTFGLSPEFFYDDSSSIRDYVNPEDHPILDEAYKKLMAGESYEIEFRILNGDDSIWIHEKGYPILDSEGNTVKTSGVCTDVTETRRLQSLLDKRQKDRDESIKYAKLIQQAASPSELLMGEIFKDYMLFHSPKGILSGDFHLADRIRSESDERFWAMALGDCTGHGIPGAILSILCSGLLKQTFFKPNVNSPAEALDDVRKQLNRVLNNNPDRTVNDGMDAGFAVFTEDFSSVAFAGANFNLYILRKEEWIVLKGDRFFVGNDDNTNNYQNHQYDLEKGDEVYMFTDGFVDQFGGENDKKYLKKKLLDFIAENSSGYSMKQFNDVIKAEFENWKGDSEQTDDVCVFGMRVV